MITPHPAAPRIAWGEPCAQTLQAPDTVHPAAHTEVHVAAPTDGRSETSSATRSVCRSQTYGDDPVVSSTPRSSACSRVLGSLTTPLRLVRRHTGTLGLALRRASVESMTGILPAKLLALGSLLGLSRLGKDHPWLVPAVALVTITCASTGGIVIGARSARAALGAQERWEQQEQPDPSGRAAKITLSSIAGGALGAVTVGGGPCAALAGGAMCGASLAYAVTGGEFRDVRSARLALTVSAAIGALLACMSTWDVQGYSVIGMTTRAPEDLELKQFSALLEAGFTELLKDGLRGVGPGLDRTTLTMPDIVRAALYTLPFYASATIGISGLAAYALKPASGERRYDEYLPSALVACLSDFVKTAVMLLMLSRCIGATIRTGSRCVSAPRARTLDAAGLRLVALASRNTVYQSIVTHTGSQAWAAGMSQLWYALCMARDVISEAIERGAARGADNQTVPLDALRV